MAAAGLTFSMVVVVLSLLVILALLAVVAWQADRIRDLEGKRQD